MSKRQTVHCKHGHFIECQLQLSDKIRGKHFNPPPNKHRVYTSSVLNGIRTSKEYHGRLGETWQLTGLARSVRELASQASSSGHGPSASRSDDLGGVISLACASVSSSEKWG